MRHWKALRPTEPLAYRTRIPPVKPSLSFLQASLEQGAKVNGTSAETWKALLETKAREVDWTKLADDIAPFLERPSEKEMLTRAFVESAIRGI